MKGTSAVRVKRLVAAFSGTLRDCRPGEVPYPAVLLSQRSNGALSDYRYSEKPRSVETQSRSTLRSAEGLQAGKLDLLVEPSLVAAFSGTLRDCRSMSSTGRRSTRRCSALWSAEGLQAGKTDRYTDVTAFVAALSGALRDCRSQWRRMTARSQTSQRSRER